MAGTKTTSGAERRGLLRRVLQSGWLTYVLAFEVFLGVVVVAALEVMPANSFQGVIVGMAISLGILTGLVVSFAVLATTIRDTFGAILGQSYGLTVGPQGLVYMALFYALGIATAVVVSSVVPDSAASAQLVPITAAPSLGLSAVVGAVVLVVLGLASLLVTLVTFRTFVGEQPEELSPELVTRRLPVAYPNLVAGTVVVGALIWLVSLFGSVLGAIAASFLGSTLGTILGTAILVVPLLVLGIGIYFWPVFVAVEDENVIAAIRSSWKLTAGLRFPVFAILVVVGTINLVVTLVASLPALFLPDVLSFLVAQFGVAFVGVFTLVIASRAYTALRDQKAI
jgi:hypothetical protein